MFYLAAVASCNSSAFTYLSEPGNQGCATRVITEPCREDEDIRVITSFSKFQALFELINSTVRVYWCQIEAMRPYPRVSTRGRGKC